MSKPSVSSAENFTTPILEWITSFLGGSFAIILLGYIAWLGLRDGHRPADLDVIITDITQSHERARIDVVVSNRGGITAADVVIAADRNFDQTEQGGEITFDFVPGQSERKGAFIFQGPVTAEEITLRVVGYREP